MSPAFQRRLHGFVVVACGAPALGALVGLITDSLGANPIETLTHITGEWGLRFLWASLAVTPLRRWLGWAALARYRRTFGLWAVTYAGLHFGIWIALDLGFEGVIDDLVSRPFVTAGFTALACLIPLAITSTRGWQKRLGRRWVSLHRLAYVAGIAVSIHYLWLVKADLLAPALHAAVLALLLLARVVPPPGRPLLSPRA